MIPSSLTHVTCAGTDEVVRNSVFYILVRLERCEDINILVNGLGEIEGLGKRSLCIPTLEGLTFNFGLPRFNGSALFYFLLLKELAALIPRYGYLVISRLLLLALIGRLASSESAHSKCKDKHHCDYGQNSFHNVSS